VVLPLWSPCPIALGAVGYLSKSSGMFVTLLNSFDPSKSSDGVVRGMPSVYGYGRVTQGTQRQDKRNAAQRGLDAIAVRLPFKSMGDGTASCVLASKYCCYNVLLILRWLVLQAGQECQEILVPAEGWTYKCAFVYGDDGVSVCRKPRGPEEVVQVECGRDYGGVWSTASYSEGGLVLGCVRLVVMFPGTDDGRV